MKPGKRFGKVLVVSVLTCCSCGLGSERAYKGDGKVTILRRVPVTAMKIDFPSFQLREPFHATYRVTGLPQSNYDYAVGLALGVPQDRVFATGRGWPGSDASIHLRLLDNSGQPIVDCNGELHRFNWHSIEGDTPFSTARAPGGLFEGVTCNSQFHISPSRAPATLEVGYTPEPTSPDALGCVRIVSTYWR